MSQAKHEGAQLSAGAQPILYSFRRCPYAMRARLALVVSQTHCELREVVLRDKPAEMLAVSPKGTVPVLVLPAGSGPAQVIEQSLEIMQWALARHDPEQWLAPPQADLAAMTAEIAICDDDFKYHLDRYKYPERYPGTQAQAHRASAGEILARWDRRLREQPFLFGDRPALADRAIAPFVRQFAHTDLAWFQGQPWPGLQAWLEAFLGSALFAQIMPKFPRWQAGDPPRSFP